MSEKPQPCYREVNGAYFTRNDHRHDCEEVDCRGCVTCPGRHCIARKSCTWHVGETELTCGRCISVVRTDLRWIESLAALMLTQAIADGLESEAASLAGPAADPEAWTWRKVAAKQGRAWHVSLIEDDDEHHPARVTGTWARMVSEDYGHDMPSNAPLAWCVAYLDRTLHRIAHDDGQDFPLLGSELKKCRQHLEAVLHNDTKPDQGAPCPACHDAGMEKPPRLGRVYAESWQADDDHLDFWRCPRDRRHVWTEYDYRLRVADWHDAAMEQGA
jgi:hypothetical protein